MSIESENSEGASARTLDFLLFNLETLKQNNKIFDIVESYLEGDYKAVLRSPTAQTLIQKLSEIVHLPREEQILALNDDKLKERAGQEGLSVFITGLASFNAFLQTNVTGPSADFGDVFTGEGWTGDGGLREKCFRSLDVDGVSVYQFIPGVELFCLARLVFTTYFPRVVGENVRDSRWMRVRINAYHQRLLSGISHGRMSDSTLLHDLIEKDLKGLEEEVMGRESLYTTEQKVMFLLEKAQIYIMEGLDYKARENVKLASKVSGFVYALSGALGKRTKFQQNDISQLVVFAKSKEGGEGDEVGNVEDELKKSTLVSEEMGEEAKNGPRALDLNDDTLLESIKFAKIDSEVVESSNLPKSLVGMKPDEQPQLQPLDQITLLTEATLKDTLSPLDKLNSEEILPFAVRVLSDKPTNWQIYTQALLVIVDQIIADTQGEPSPSADGIPQIQVTSFLPRAKANESAPVTERLKYINQLNTPTRWELETELAYAWSNAGSLVSALEIFKRLKLWAEVALCYHSVNQEEKARQIVRRQLYYSSQGPEMDKYDIDAPEIVTERWDGEMRSPPPPHAPRLWCILGDLDQDPKCWQRAWEVSKNRYARAQRTLGDYYTRQNDLESARDAYIKATIVNRQNNDTWSRLGDIDLRVGNWDGAIIAFQQSIMIDDTDAKTYSNLGSALLSKHAELVSVEKLSKQQASSSAPETDDQEIDFSETTKSSEPSPREILRQALTAYKRGASLAHDNWKIWDNVITIAGRMSPPSYPEVLLGLRNIIRIRGPSIGENAIDIDVLGSLVAAVVSQDHDEEKGTFDEKGVYTPPRGSLARAVIEVLEREVRPLITKRVELYEILEKVAVWRRDWREAMECAEKGWRGSMKVVGSGGGEKWLEDEGEWEVVVGWTERLCSAYENYGDGEGEGKWKGKARKAVRGVLGRARDVWEGTKGWDRLVALQEELNS
ncbi:hypothetical protein ACMFMG_000402 [Clarireedia jacksonii]